MSALTKLLTGAAGIAAVVGFASPAAAQYYPNNGYGYPNQGGNVVGQILQGVLGYGQYPHGNYGYNQVNQRQAVNQCARAVENRLNYSGGYGGYNQGYAGYGYNQGYGNQGYGYNQGHGGGRVLGVTRVERRNNGVRVRGVASSGGGYGGGYGYNQGYGQADLSFSCKVDYRGRVTDVDLDRRNTGFGYRGY